MTPTQIIEHRAILYTKNAGLAIYDLYADTSDLKKFFCTPEIFAEHFEEIKEGNDHAGLKIISETIKGGLAEVKFIEYFIKNEEVIAFYSRTRLSKINDSWKILNEEREMAVH